MIAQQRQLQVALVLVGDVLATAAALLLSYWLRFQSGVVPVTKGNYPLEMYLRLLPAVVLLWPAVFYFQGLYQRSSARLRFNEAVRLLLGGGIATVILTAGLTFYRPPGFSYSRLFLGMFAAVSVALVILSRWSITTVLARIRHSKGQVVLVVGAGDLGRQVVERLEAHREFGFRVIGYLDDDPGLQGRTVSGAPVLGSTADLEQIVESERVDQVILALPLAAHYRTEQLIRRAGQLPVAVRVVPDLVQYYVLRAGIEDLDGLPVINLTRPPLRGAKALLKRAFDIVGSLLLLLLIGWMFPLIAWFIRREDGGPVFYGQVRTGLDGRSFTLFKFRSMTTDAEPNGQVRWSRTRDPRVTRVGAWLRRFNLDELPQLVNVLLGDMSLVGPRPERPEFVERFRSRYPEYTFRHRVRTGLTGWAQVHGLRGDTSIRRRVAHDLYYIENWSMGLDIKILLMTARLSWRQLRAGD